MIPTVDTEQDINKVGEAAYLKNFRYYEGKLKGQKPTELSEEQKNLIRSIVRKTVVKDLFYKDLFDVEKGGELPPVLAAEIQKVEEFCEKIVSSLNSQIIDGSLTSLYQLRALLAAIYKREEGKNDPSTEEMFMMLFALIQRRVSFDISGATEDVLDKFLENNGHLEGSFKGDGNWESFSYNLFVQHLVELVVRLEFLPYKSFVNYWAEQEKVDKQINKILQIKEELRRRLSGLKNIVIRYMLQVLNLPKEKIEEVVDGLFSMPLVILPSNYRYHYKTNQQAQIEDLYQSLSGQAIAFEEDKILGKSLSAYSLPYNWQELNIDEIVGKLGHSVLHEIVHHIGELIYGVDWMDGISEYDVDWLHMINELLTDTAALFINSEVDISSKRELVQIMKKYSGGYFELVRFGSDLLRLNLVEGDELLSYAFQQQPQFFVEKLNKRLKEEREDTVLELVRSLSSRWLIRPLTQQEAEQLVNNIQKGGVKVLEDEMMKMWRRVGNQYFGTHFFMFTIVEELGGNLESDYTSVLKNEDGWFKEKAVKAFEKVTSASEKLKKLWLLPEGLFEESTAGFVYHDESNVKYDLDINKDKLLVQALINLAGVVIAGSGVQREKLTSTDVISIARSLYGIIIHFIQAKDTEGKKYDVPREEIRIFIEEVLVPFFSREHLVPQEAEDALKAILSPLKVNKKGGLYYPSFDQLTHYGSILSQHKKTPN